MLLVPIEGRYYNLDRLVWCSILDPAKDPVELFKATRGREAAGFSITLKFAGEPEPVTLEGPPARKLAQALQTQAVEFASA